MQDNLAPLARQGTRLSLVIGKQIDLGLVDVDALEVAEIYRVGGRGPDAAEEIGLSNLEP